MRAGTARQAGCGRSRILANAADFTAYGPLFTSSAGNNKSGHPAGRDFGQRREKRNRGTASDADGLHTSSRHQFAHEVTFANGLHQFLISLTGQQILGRPAGSMSCGCGSIPST